MLLPRLKLGLTTEYSELYAARWAYLFHVQNWVAAVSDPAGGSFLPHFWSLAIEEQFYLAWPICVYLMPRGRAGGGVCLGIASVILVGRCLAITLFGHVENIGSFLHYSTITRIDTLLIGAALAYASNFDARYESIGRAARWSIPLLGGLAALLAMLGGDVFGSPMAQGPGYTLIAIGSASLIWILSLPESDRSPLAHPALRYLGKISFRPLRLPLARHPGRLEGL